MRAGPWHHGAARAANGGFACRLAVPAPVTCEQDRAVAGASAYYDDPVFPVGHRAPPHWPGVVTR